MMADEVDDVADQIKETDIVFDCPHCGKSLAIDYRGAGLTIPCTDCGKHVEVPIPEGMELTDLDSSREEQEIRILNLRRLLSEAEARIVELEDELQDIDERRRALELAHAERLQSFKAVLDQVAAAQRTLDEITRRVRDLMAAKPA